MEAQTTRGQHGVATDLEAQKYVLFGLAGETYGLSLLQLQEVLSTYEYTVTPNLPDFFHGVIAVRGEVIPVLNLRKRFGFPEAERDRGNRVIVVDLQPNPIGIQVDEIFRVVRIRGDRIERAPELTCGQRIPYVTGVSERDDGKLVIHLDIQKVLSSLEQIELAQIAETIAEARAARESSAAGGTPRRTGTGVDETGAYETEDDQHDSDPGLAESSFAELPLCRPRCWL
jgi:purine-binding chemotaxis protein CheW